MALKEQQKLEKELTGYVEWICRAEDLVLAEDRTTESDKELIMEGWCRYLPTVLAMNNQHFCSEKETSGEAEEDEFHQD